MEDKTIQQNNPLDMSEFVGKLQKEDRRNMSLSRNMQWGMWILSIFYAVFFIVIPFYENTLYKAIGWSLYVLTFLSFGFIFNYLKREYRRVDYGLPTLVMLKEAAKRYKFFQRKTTLATMPVILVDVGMVLVTFDPGQPGSLLRTILVSQALFIPAIGIGLFIGNIIWRKRQKPLRDAALKMINELEE
ncbi:MAG: hypothetical protein JXR50_00780 [Prolixibacteraceae bacterium]|nr:hypothetical protein [Prolixibacteraceae bacterium]MBN2648256.1 hypothetical protein [Prolixibacteraceae bacterium]